MSIQHEVNAVPRNRSMYQFEAATEPQQSFFSTLANAADAVTTSGMPTRVQALARRSWSLMEKRFFSSSAKGLVGLVA